MSKHDKVDHHDHEAIVELIRVPTRIEGDILIASCTRTASTRSGGPATPTAGHHSSRCSRATRWWCSRTTSTAPAPSSH